MKTKRELILNQVALADEVRAKAGINIVTCGNCGTILLHRIRKDYLTCVGCRNVMDVCDCPDLWYTGIENNFEWK